MKGSRKQKQDRRGRRGDVSPSHPPEIQSYGLTHSTRLRFTSVAAAAQTLISFQNLLDTMNFAASAVTAFQMFDRVKIKLVEVWATPVIGNATTVQVEFLGTVAGVTGDSRIHTDTSMGIQPAHVRASPLPRSGTALFQGTAAGNAFALTCPAGSVIDVQLSLKGVPSLANATTNAPVAATPGAWYYRGLDGLAAAGTNFPPVINASGVD